MSKILLKHEQEQNISGKLSVLLDSAYGRDTNKNNLTKNFNLWKTNKKNLYNIFSTSPYWNEDELCIVLNSKVNRKLDFSLAQNIFKHLLENHQIREDKHKYEICRACKNLFSYINKKEFDGYINKEFIDNIEKQYYGSFEKLSDKELIERLDAGIYDSMPCSIDAICYALVKKYSIREGQKLCKVLNKILTTEKCDIGKTDLYEARYNPQIKGVRDYVGKDSSKWYIDYYYSYNQLFAVLSDILSPVEYDETFYISINPIDYLTQSHGNNWQSCHSLRYQGCYHSATLTMMTDKTSVIVYTLPSKEASEFSLKDKKTRQSLFIGENNNIIFQNSFYPSKDMNESSVVRLYLEELISNYMNVPNKWVKTPNYDNFILDNYLGYCDWDNGQAFCAVVLKDTDKSTILEIGHKAYSVDLEDQYVHVSESLRAEYRYCSDCESLTNTTYLAYYDAYICDDCLENNYYYCDDVNDYRYYDDCIYLEDLQKYVSKDYDCYYCEKCQCFYSKIIELEDNEFICEDCLLKMNNSELNETIETKEVIVECYEGENNE